MTAEFEHSQIAGEQLPPLIPRRVFFGNPERISVQLSPDGQYLGFLAPDEKDVLQVWVRKAGETEDRKMTEDPKRGIRAYFWGYDGEHLLYIQDKDGDENFHLYAVNMRDANCRDLTPIPGVNVSSVMMLPAYPGEIVLGMNQRDPRFFDAYHLRLDSGELTLVAENPGDVMGWRIDQQLCVRAAVGINPDGSSDVRVRDTIDAPWRVLLHVSAEENAYPINFSEDGRELYLIDNHHADTLRLTAIELATGAESVLAEEAGSDFSTCTVHPLTQKIQAVRFEKERELWQVLDAEIAEDFAAIKAACRGDFVINSRTLADDVWLVAERIDDGPVYYYRYERSSKHLAKIFSSKQALETLPLTRMQPISYPARDGLAIHGYLTLPRGATAEHLPTMLLVHGGPWGRDSWLFHPEVQWLANRGYAVLQVNFRGSAGYGKAFLNAGNREWAGKMHDDLIDGVNWIIAQGVADPRRIAIMGGSYGGYATLVGLTFTPEVFVAGVDLVGPSNIVTLLHNPPPYWQAMMPMLFKRVGALEEEEFLRSRSPLTYVERIQVPLLIGQGANDPRVKQQESEQIVAAMRKNGKPVRYVLYADEGHGFARPENRLHFYALAEEFLAQYLGGRCEPMDEIAGHTGEIRADFP